MQFVDKFSVITKFVLLTILIAGLGLTAFGQKQKSKGDLVKEIAALTKANTPADLAKAYEISKDYIARFGTDTDENTGKIKMFVSNYRTDIFYKAVDGKNATEAFKLGDEILKATPDDAAIYMNMAFVGFNAISAGGKDHAVDTISSAGSAIKLINDGKLPTSWAPFADQEEALGWLYYFQAIASQNIDLKAAATGMYRSVSHRSPVKTSMDPYYFIAFYYEKIYESISQDLNAKITARSISADAEKVERARVDKCLDLMLDAYARAVKYAEAGKSPKLSEVKDRYSQIYKFRKGTDIGLPQFYAGIDATPMPDPSSFK